MKKIIATVALFALVGCTAQQYTAKTNVKVSVAPDGTCNAEYTSDKEQQGLEASVCGGHVKVDRSGTLESIVAAQSQAQAALLAQIARLIELIPAAARAGALSGS